LVQEIWNSFIVVSVNEKRLQNTNCSTGQLGTYTMMINQCAILVDGSNNANDIKQWTMRQKIRTKYTLHTSVSEW